MPGTAKEWDEVTHKIAMERAGKPLLPKWDEVTKPEHYNSGAVECIEAIEASMSPEEFKGYLKGNCLKYLWRYQYKGKPAQDLAKAQWYLDRLAKLHAPS